MLTDICIKFGCGKTLTLQEKLCGNTCIAHSNEPIKTIGRPITIDLYKKQISATIDKLEKRLDIIRNRKNSKSPTIMDDRKVLIVDYEIALLLLNKLL